ncbi:MAG TPA: NlpC/P60 family protein [Pseudonocardiaceae bacterium]
MKRSVQSTLAALAVVTTVSLLPAPAGADPELPSTASEAVKELAELSRQAEQLTEEYHAATDALAARQAEFATAQTDFTTATAKAEEAKVKQEEFRAQVDKLAAASFQGARFNQLSALLVSESPQDFLDQMSALDLLAADNQRSIDELGAVVKEAEAAAAAATDASTRAKEAEQQAAQIQADVAKRKTELETRQGEVQRRLDQLNGADRQTLRGGGDLNIPIPPASGVAGEAMNHALSKRGAPYVWASEGPNSFDCSGLVYWAYQQVGITLPRSSRSQATVGSPVPRSAIQPGDLLFFYSPVSHVGISVGGNNMVHAPQSGDVVKVADWTRMPLTAVRRVGG